MHQLKSFIKKYFRHFAWFYRFLRYRIFVAMALSLVIGLLDGIGLAMFLPLLQLVGGNSESGEELGGLSFVLDWFERLGVPITLTGILVLIVTFFSLKGLGMFARLYYETLVRLYFVRKLRFHNVEKLANFSYKNFVTADAGRIQNTMSGEINRVSAAYSSYFSTVQSWVMVLIYIALAFATNAQFALLVVIGGFLSNLIYRQIYKRTVELSKKITLGGHQFQRLLIQMVAFFKYLKATGFINPYGRKLKRTIVDIENANKKIGFYNAILYASREPLIIVVVALVILVQVKFLSAGLGGIILSLMFFYRSLNYVLALQTSWNQFLNASGALTNMTGFMHELEQGQEQYGTQPFTHFRDRIRVNDVSFSYDAGPILSHISLEIPLNQTVAFVGESGSGKTTLVNLLTGLMPVDSGAITIDGIPYPDLDLRSLQQKIGYITQDSVIFSDSVYDNVTQWAPKTDENLQKFWKVAEQAAIAEFIRSLPQGEDSLLGNNGIQVSGGQKQRISIARELYKEPAILVMDEATSALDSETERAIQENIEKLQGRYTILIVAHRLSTIRHADAIVLLDKGAISARGTYNQLIEECEAFGRMVSMQDV